MRLMSYNIEWFDDLFSPDNRTKTDAATTARLTAIAQVIQTVDPDLIGITEAPNTTTTTGVRDTVAALEVFAAAQGLRQSKALLGYPSAGRQEIAVLYDPTVLTVEHVPGGRAGAKKNPPFNEEFYIDSDGDDIREVYKHYRPPLEVKVTRTDSGSEFWMMVVHAKSKGIFNAMDRVHFDRTSTRNRRKLFAECTSIRQRVDDWLDDDHPTIVMGDINDGPGFDFYEARFGRSAVELIMGAIWAPDRVLRSAVEEPTFGRFGWEPSTARFTDQFTGDRINALIDHVLVSKHLAPADAGFGVVWNPYQTTAAEPLKAALMAASDHFPVTVDIA